MCHGTSRRCRAPGALLLSILPLVGRAQSTRSSPRTPRGSGTAWQGRARSPGKGKASSGNPAPAATLRRNVPLSQPVVPAPCSFLGSSRVAPPGLLAPTRAMAGVVWPQGDRGGPNFTPWWCSPLLATGSTSRETHRCLRCCPPPGKHKVVF